MGSGHRHRNRLGRSHVLGAQREAEPARVSRGRGSVPACPGGSCPALQSRSGMDIPQAGAGDRVWPRLGQHRARIEEERTPTLPRLRCPRVPPERPPGSLRLPACPQTAVTPGTAGGCGNGQEKRGKCWRRAGQSAGAQLTGPINGEWQLVTHAVNTERQLPGHSPGPSRGWEAPGRAGMSGGRGEHRPGASIIARSWRIPGSWERERLQERDPVECGEKGEPGGVRRDLGKEFLLGGGAPGQVPMEWA